ncbi:hypothetical protein [Thalassotalea euphylliae]|uniref:Uncharacterized protein n=1 Tax=Thalassotalea euphylliae TaxID=1655234 RepID=A0A3E0TYU9_9GAMM|nr:hypothetical protein [Thalassotalea euphylliae]REL29861.1 hypothetical protein DXX94_03600 [Thalassotalea euphylliae]
MKTVNFLINVISVPADLLAIADKPEHELYVTYQLYQNSADSNLLHKVWMIDEYNELWLEINFVDEEGEPAFHTLKLDSGSYEKVEFESYSVLTE